MNNLGRMCMLVLITCISVTLVSCGDDEEAPSVKSDAVAVTDATVYELGGIYATIGGEMNVQAIPLEYTNIEYGIEICEKADFSNKTRHVASWKSGDKFRVYITTLSEQMKYYYRAYVSVLSASSDSYDYYGETQTFTTKKIIDDDNYVDLGLTSGTKWALMNIGAKTPEELGDFFAWGEIEKKDVYSWDTYKWCEGSSNQLTKYCSDSDYGQVDNEPLSYLETVDDVAKAKWGENWCMPTKRQFEELRKACVWNYTERNGVPGYDVTSTKNSNSIFIPASGYQDNTSINSDGSYGYYWSRSLNTETPNPTEAWALFLGPSQCDMNTYRRYIGLCVRPVRVIEE